MDLSEVQKFDSAPVGTIKLSDAIREGTSIVQESHFSFRLCALGCAWAAVKGHQITDQEFEAIEGESDDDYAAAIGRELGFDPEICKKVSSRHHRGIPAREIADWLESQGY